MMMIIIMNDEENLCKDLHDRHGTCQAQWQPQPNQLDAASVLQMSHYSFGWSRNSLPYMGRSGSLGFVTSRQWTLSKAVK
jgi:hypothetical protein